MNNALLHKLISFAAAGAVCMSLLSFSAIADATNGASASDDFSDLSDLSETAEVLRLGDVTAYLVEAPDGEVSEVSDLGAVRENESFGASGDDFLEKIKGIEWGYGYLDNFPDPKAAKNLYNELYKFSAALWNNPDDIAGDTARYIDLGDNTWKEKQVLGIVKPTVSMTTSQETSKVASKIYYLFRHDHPEFYYCGMSILSYTSGQIAIMLEDTGYLKGLKRIEYQYAVKNYLKTSESLVHNDYTRTDYQNSLELYKKVMNGMSYATVNGRPSEEPFAHNILGGILDHSGVCESYAKIFSMMLNYHGIDNVYVAGDGKGEAHAWNLVKLDDGQYYYADSTWDDRGSYNGNDNKYFATCSATFCKDHTPYDPDMTYGTFLYTLPDTGAKDFDPNGNYRSTNHRLIDFDKSSSISNRDIKELQKLIVQSGVYISYYDVNNDKKVNNRDLKELQRLITTIKA